MKSVSPHHQLPCRRPLSALALLAAGLLAAGSLHAQTPSLVLSPKWSLAYNARADLSGTANTERGVAINKLTGNVLFATRAQSNHIAVVSGVDGSDLGALNNSGITGGTLAMEHVRVADDGVIYACNLYGGSGSSFKLYRWNSEADGLLNPPYVAYNSAGSPVGAGVTRYGDSFDLRGAGTNTQIIASGSSATHFALFTTTDGTNFTATEFPSTAGIGANDYGKALSFDGTNNAFYCKNSGSSSLRYISFDPVAVTSTLVTTISVSPDSNLVGVKSYATNGIRFVAGEVTTTSTTAGTHHLKAYTINNPAAPIVSADFLFPSPGGVAGNNGNIIGATDVGAGMVVGLDTDNGIVALSLNFVTNLPPSVVTQPVGNTNVLQGGYATIAVSANGTTPLHYQWLFNGTNTLAGATNANLAFTNLGFAAAGLYSCVITNVAGAVTSAPAPLGITASVQSAADTLLWSASVGDLFVWSNDNSQRGLAYNPVTGHLIVVGRSPSNGVHVLNANTGAYISSLDTSLFVPGTGTFEVNLVGVGGDGVIYVANLDTSGAGYTIYSWADENPGTTCNLAWGPGDPGVGQRIGDTFAVRGAGANTELLAGTRNGTQVVLFTTGDGVIFNPNIIDTAPQPAGLAGLGIAFGAGNTFWTKSTGYQFRHLTYDLTQGTNGLLETFATGQTTCSSVAVDPINNLLAGINSYSTPHDLELYDVQGVVSGTAAEPNLIDQDFFKTSNDNLNGTSAAAFDVAGGRLFALDTNNGMLAFKVVARLFTQTSGANVTYLWTGPSVLQSATKLGGPWVTVPGAASGYTAPAPTANAQFFRLAR